MSEQQQFLSPLASRYASQEMLALFSPQKRHTLWHQLWVALARAQKEAGLPITSKQIVSMEAAVGQIHWNLVAKLEEEMQHDVMAHIAAFASLCPEARGIIHLGATSCYVTDNGDLMQIGEASHRILTMLRQLLKALSDFALRYADLPCLAYTHLQPAQPTTVGKRATLWLYQFMKDLEQGDHLLRHLTFLGVKGATGTQASLLALTGGDALKVEEIEESVAKQLGWKKLQPVSGQTYCRKQDLSLLAWLAQIGVSAHKMATDLRLLSHMGELEEPRKKSQVGSSAMPHKRNPMLCERICGLSRLLITSQESAAYTASLQWLERTLDDSSIRRILIPEAFLTCDAILSLCCHVISGLKVYPHVIAQNLERELPLLMGERLLMAAVKKGVSREEAHQLLRQALEQAFELRQQGQPLPPPHNLFPLKELSITSQELAKELTSPHLTGLASQQTKAFIQNHIAPLL